MSAPAEPIPTKAPDAEPAPDAFAGMSTRGLCRHSVNPNPKNLTAQQLECHRYPPVVSPLVEQIKLGQTVQTRVNAWSSYPTVLRTGPACGEFSLKIGKAQ